MDTDRTKEPQTLPGGYRTDISRWEMGITGHKQTVLEALDGTTMGFVLVRFCAARGFSDADQMPKTHIFWEELKQTSRTERKNASVETQ